MQALGWMQSGNSNPRAPDASNTKAPPLYTVFLSSMFSRVPGPRHATTSFQIPSSLIWVWKGQVIDVSLRARLFLT